MTETATDTAVIPAPANTPVPVSDAVVAAYESMLATVPDAGADDPTLSILAQIDASPDVAGLDSPWRADGLESVERRPLTIRGIRKRTSDFPGALPWYLILDAVAEDTGEMLTITTGSVGVVAQLVKAWQLGAFPLRCFAVKADRPSSSGYYPMHLAIRRQG